MDLFVLDTVGETTALEDRVVPILGRKKTTPATCKTPTTTTTTTTSTHTPRIRNHEDDHGDDDDDDDDDEEDDDEDDDDDDADYGSCYTADLSAIRQCPLPAAAAAASAPTDPIEAIVERYCRLMRTAAAAAADDRNTEDDAAFANPELSRTDVAREMRDSTNTDMESALALPNPSEKNKAKLRKLEAAKSKGSKWFGMPATELTDEVKRDLEIIQMRSVLDPKHFYKKNDLKALPKYFQVGKVLPSALDHYGERGTRTGKKKTIVDELMADAQFQRFNKRKYTETVEEGKRNGLKKAHSKMKKLKKNK